jgi:protein-S-isoprenylcysteine O-methyltransferase Ste14
MPTYSSVSTLWLHTAGGWLFRQRSWLPVPFTLMLVTIRWRAFDHHWVRWAGIMLVVMGEALRLWSVRHIGVISRTRAARLGPLIATGPYQLTRNPLYLANAFLWCGFVAWSGLLWMEPLAVLLFALQYELLVRWEERQLAARFDAAYEAYRKDTPRWRPRLDRLALAWTQRPAHAWNDVLFSERGTLLTVALLAVLLTLKHAWR